MDGKTCTKCGKFKSLAEFWRKAGSSDGRRPMCSECGQAYNKVYAKQQSRQTRRKSRLLREYGLSSESFAELLESQGGGCAICDAEVNARDRYMCVDHDHESGQRRGLLCVRCNWALGYFRDSVDLLKKAITYLEYYSEILDSELPDWPKDRELEPEAKRQISESGQPSGLKV
jgi:hypothetical protein